MLHLTEIRATPEQERRLSRLFAKQYDLDNKVTIRRHLRYEKDNPVNLHEYVTFFYYGGVSHKLEEFLNGANGTTKYARVGNKIFDSYAEAEAFIAGEIKAHGNTK